jgi:hypothetical protein
MKKRSPIHAYKRLLARAQDWDYAFLIALEKKKLQRMHDYFKYQGHPEANRMAARDLAICIRLIDIFMQDDAAYNTWSSKSPYFPRARILTDFSTKYRQIVTLTM